jgi:hypothetical protein
MARRLDEDGIVGDVVRIGGHGGHHVGERHNLEAAGRVFLEAGAFDHVAGEVRGRCGAAAVAADEDLAALVAGVRECGDNAVHCGGVQRLQGFNQKVSILGGVAHVR